MADKKFSVKVNGKNIASILVSKGKDNLYRATTLFTERGVRFLKAPGEETRSRLETTDLNQPADNESDQAIQKLEQAGTSEKEALTNLKKALRTKYGEDAEIILTENKRKSA